MTRPAPDHSAVRLALGRFSVDGQKPFVGAVFGDEVVALTDLPVTAADRAVDGRLDPLFEVWDGLVAELAEWRRRQAAPLAAARPLADLRVHAPVTPGQVFQSGANYRTHVIDLMVAQQIDRRPDEDVDALRDRAARAMDERVANGRPYVFVGLGSAICGPHDDVLLPDAGTQHDWELELGVVIGRPARRVPRADALDYVAGYTIVDDITTRDLVFRPDIPGIGTDWLASKNAPTFSPTGPYVVPAAFVDPARLRIVLRVGGRVMQDGETSDMIFDVPSLIEYVSAITELRPGNLLMTGSPAGNGAHHGRYLRPGDVLDGEITGLGRQRNRCVPA